MALTGQSGGLDSPGSHTADRAVNATMCGRRHCSSKPSPLIAIGLLDPTRSSRAQRRLAIERLRRSRRRDDRRRQHARRTLNGAFDIGTNRHGRATEPILQERSTNPSSELHITRRGRRARGQHEDVLEYPSAVPADEDALMTPDQSEVPATYGESEESGGRFNR